MSEYTYVEKPFLDQLDALGWQVIDHGEGVPGDPTISYRTSFREVTLKGVFKESVKAINRTDDGQEWLTDEQLNDLHDELLNPPGKSLVEINQNILHFLLRDGEWKPTVDENDLTGEQNPDVKLIDFDHPERNDFVAINQFRINTPGRVKEHIRPDIVLFVNGLPLVVVECKDANEYTANPMHEAVKQLRRYSDQREETHEAGLKEALQLIPELREQFWSDVKVPGEGQDFNQALEHAGRVSDFLDFGELMCRDALVRKESCGGHFREEYQTSEGEALRDDENFSFVSAWGYEGEGREPTLNKEPLHFENVKLATRSYK